MPAALKINFTTSQTGTGEGCRIIDLMEWFIDFKRITEHEWRSDHLRMSIEWSGSIAIIKCILSTALNGDTIKCGATIRPTIIIKIDLGQWKGWKNSKETEEIFLSNEYTKKIMFIIR